MNLVYVIYIINKVVIDVVIVNMLINFATLLLSLSKFWILNRERLECFSNFARSVRHGSITCCTDRANEANKMFIYGFVDYSEKGTK